MIAVCDAAVAAPKCNGGGNPAVVSASSLNFGSYNAASASPTDANVTVAVFCASIFRELPAFTVALSRGGAPSYTPRTLASGANTLNYNIFTTSGYTTIWGDGTGGTSTLGNGGGTWIVLFTGFGRIPVGQYVAAGSYTDTITVTVTY
jgi:spore coat protein U-like protein